MLKTVFSRIRRSPYQSLAAGVMMIIAFFVATVYLLSAMSAQRMLAALEARPQAIAFFKDEAKAEEIEKLKTEISQTVSVKNISFLSKEDALKRYQEQNKSDPLLLELVTANILPASLEVSTVNAADLSTVVKIMKDVPIVEDVSFAQEETRGLINWVESIRYSGLVLVSALGLESVFILLIIFALKISRRKDEIGVMRLVGASSWQIRLPFLIEGMLLGLISAAVAFGLSYYFVVIKHINPLGTIPAISEFAVPFDLSVINLIIWAAVEMAIGMFVGLLGSFLSVWRYLKD